MIKLHGAFSNKEIIFNVEDISTIAPDRMPWTGCVVRMRNGDKWHVAETVESLGKDVPGVQKDA